METNYLFANMKQLSPELTQSTLLELAELAKLKSKLLINKSTTQSIANSSEVSFYNIKNYIKTPSPLNELEDKNNF
jgi:hypothetical protein